MGGLMRARVDTGANWASYDPILRSGELGYDTTRGILHVGDGVTPVSGLQRMIMTSGPVPDWKTDQLPNALATYFPTITGDATRVEDSPFSAGAGHAVVMLRPRVGTGASVATSTTKWVQTKRFASIKARIRFDSVPAIGTSADCLTLQNVNGVNHFDWFVSQTTGFLSWDLLSSDIGTTGYRPVLGKWYTVEAIVDFGATTYSAWVAVNGVPYPVIQSVGQVASTVRSFHFAGPNTKSYDMAGTDFSVAVSDTMPTWAMGGPAV